jgi:hypothetical protein
LRCQIPAWLNVHPLIRLRIAVIRQRRPTCRGNMRRFSINPDVINDLPDSRVPSVMNTIRRICPPHSVHKQRVSGRNTSAAAPVRRGRAPQYTHLHPPKTRCAGRLASLWRHNSPAAPADEGEQDASARRAPTGEPATGERRPEPRHSLPYILAASVKVRTSGIFFCNHSWSSCKDVSTSEGNAKMVSSADLGSSMAISASSMAT